MNTTWISDDTKEVLITLFSYDNDIHDGFVGMKRFYCLKIYKKCLEIKYDFWAWLKNNAGGENRSTD